MSQIIPFEPSVPFYEFNTVLDGTPVIFNVRWNGRDAAWYFDLLQDDATPILHGTKIVFGTYLGRRSRHPLLRAGALVPQDFAPRDPFTPRRSHPGFDDLGVNALVVYMTQFEIAAKLRAGLEKLKTGAIGG